MCDVEISTFIPDFLERSELNRIQKLPDSSCVTYFLFGRKNIFVKSPHDLFQCVIFNSSSKMQNSVFQISLYTIYEYSSRSDKRKGYSILFKINLFHCDYSLSSYFHTFLAFILLYSLLRCHRLCYLLKYLDNDSLYLLKLSDDVLFCHYRY